MLARVQDTSKMRVRRISASVKPHNKATVRLNQLPCPFLPEHMRYVSGICAGCVWGVFERYLTFELYCKCLPDNDEY